jgi:hypothetical protein
MCRTLPEDRDYGPCPPDLLRKVCDYPLFEALYGRRSRRFGLGFAVTEDPFEYNRD